MKSRSRSWFAPAAFMAGLVIMGLVLPGCQSEKTTGKSKSPTGKSPTTATQTPAKPAEPSAKEITKPTEEKATATKTAEPAKAVDEKKTEEPAKKTEEPAKPVEEKKTEAPAKVEEKKTEEAKPAEKKPEEPGKKTEGAEPPAVPKLSTFAPAADLVSQAEKTGEDLMKATESEAEFKDADTGVARDAKILALTAVALSLHDEENKYKASAAAIYQAAEKLAAAKDYAAVKPVAAELKDALDGKAKAGGELKWSDVPPPKLLWPQAESIKTRLPTEKDYKKRVKNAPRNSAILAVIAQVALLKPDTKTPDETKQWNDFSIQMRDAAAALNSAVRANDEKAVVAARDKLDKSCNDCHAVFRKEDKEKK